MIIVSPNEEYFLESAQSFIKFSTKDYIFVHSLKSMRIFEEARGYPVSKIAKSNLDQQSKLDFLFYLQLMSREKISLLQAEVLYNDNKDLFHHELGLERSKNNTERSSPKNNIDSVYYFYAIMFANKIPIEVETWTFNDAVYLFKLLNYLKSDGKQKLPISKQNELQLKYSELNERRLKEKK